MSKGLGKGFGALLPGEDSFSPVAYGEAGEQVKTIALTEIKANPSQPRKEFDQAALNELAESIREQGVIQPILVEQVLGGYQIVAGERRFRAAKLAGLSEIPALVRTFSEESRMEIALIENIQRSDLTPMEEARAYRNLMESFALTQEEVSQKVGKQRSTIANALRLLKLPESMQMAIDQGQITPGHARAILSVTTPAGQQSLFDTIVAQGLSVREAEELALRLNGAGPAPKPTVVAPVAPRLPELVDLERQFMERLGTKVSIKGTEKKGRIEIAYFSLEDLNRVYEILGQTAEEAENLQP